MNNEIRNESQALPESIRCVGADDLTLSLFENQYPVQPMGVSYNSYLILDEKIAVMDSVDARAADEWLAKLAHELNGRSPDYLVISHMEPDHSGSILRLAERYPEMQLVGNGPAQASVGRSITHCCGFVAEIQNRNRRSQRNIADTVVAAFDCRI